MPEISQKNVETPEGIEWPMEHWCDLSIIIKCGSLNAALDVLRRITSEEDGPPAVHQNAIAVTLIERKKK
jgi:hypothetical protein